MCRYLHAFSHKALSISSLVSALYVALLALSAGPCDRHARARPPRPGGPPLGRRRLPRSANRVVPPKCLCYRGNISIMTIEILQKACQELCIRCCGEKMALSPEQNGQKSSTPSLNSTLISNEISCEAKFITLSPPPVFPQLITT